MATLTAQKSGSWKTASTWSPEQIPTSADDCIVPTGIEVKVDSTGCECKTVETTGAAKVNLTKVLSIVGTKVTLSSETVWTVTSLGALKISTAGGSTCEIKTGGVDLKVLNLTGSGTTKYKLLDALTASTELSLKAGLLTTANFNVTIPKFVFESATAKELILGSSVVKITGTGTVWNDTTFNLGVKGETSTVEFTGTTATFASVATGYNAITFTGKTITIENTSGEGWVAATVNFSLTGAEREVRWAAGGVYKVNTAIAKTSGVQKWVSSTSGTAFKLKGTISVTLEELELKDSNATELTAAKDVNGTDLLGNAGWTFETTGGSVGHVVGVA